jgi:hypothetical protein
MVGAIYPERAVEAKVKNPGGGIVFYLVRRLFFATMRPRFSIQKERKHSMAEDSQQSPAQGDQQVQVLLDERELRTVYSNAYRIHTAAEEVVVDLGFNMPNPNQQPGQNQQLLFKVTDRVVMSYANAKRLAASLQQLVKRYEQQFGELPAQPGQRRA